MSENIKFSLSDAPTWNFDKGDPESLEIFLKDLQVTKDLKIIEDDKCLIWASLKNSEKTEIYSSLTEEETKNVDKFIAFLRANYGPSLTRQLLDVKNLQQKSDESAPAFKARLERIYFRARSKMVPATIDDATATELRLVYVNGLKNEEIKKYLRLNELSIKYSELAEYSRKYEESLDLANNQSNDKKIEQLQNLPNDQGDHKINNAVEKIQQKIDKLTLALNVSNKNDHEKNDNFKESYKNKLDGVNNYFVNSSSDSDGEDYDPRSSSSDTSEYYISDYSRNEDFEEYSSDEY